MAQDTDALQEIREAYDDEETRSRSERKATMRVKNYRRVRAEPLVEVPGVTVRWLVSDLDEAPGFAMRLYEMQPSAETTAHPHYWEHQGLILSGKGAVIGKGSELPLGEGDMVHVPPTGLHQFVNRGSEALRLMEVLPIRERTAL